MKYKRRIVASILWIIIGAVLFTLEVLGIGDPFWSGMGTALLVVGILQIIKYIRYFNNAEYREKVDISQNDERNKFISAQAHAWAAYVYVIASATATIGFKIAGYDELSLFASISLCFMIIAYAVAYIVLSKKY